MAKTSAQLLKEIESLTKTAQAMRKRELPAVIDRIKQDIAAYGLTASDLGLGGGDSKPSAAPTKTPALKTVAKKAAARPGGKVPIKYRDGNGNSWSGRGSKPGWLQAALAAGQTLESFDVGSDARPAKAAKPPPPKAASSASKIKYRDDAGHSWSGFGPKPGWLKAAIESGKTLEQLAVGGATESQAAAG